MWDANSGIRSRQAFRSPVLRKNDLALPRSYRLGVKDDIVAVSDRWLHRAPDCPADEHSLVELADSVDLEGELWGEVFEPLKGKTLFAKFVLDKELNTIVWPNGADFAPEFLYQKLRLNYTLKPTPKSGAA